MRFKFTNVSEGHTIGADVVPTIAPLTPLSLTKNVFYVYLVVAPTKLV